MNRSIEPTDEELMLAYAAGDATAFDALLERHRRRLFGYLVRSLPTRSEAEDVFQDVLMKVVRSAATWRHEARFTTWLYTLARNAIIDRARRRKTRGSELPLATPGDAPEQSGIELRDGSPSPLDDALGGELAEALERALETLPGEQREALLLKREGLTFDEIALATGAGANTIKSRLRYALEKLRKALEERGLKVPR